MLKKSVGVTLAGWIPLVSPIPQVSVSYPAGYSSAVHDLWAIGFPVCHNSFP